MNARCCVNLCCYQSNPVFEVRPVCVNLCCCCLYPESSYRPLFTGGAESNYVVGNQLHAKFAVRCAYCGCELGDRWHADHFEPVIRLADERGAEQPANHTISNMMPACAPCNISKGRQTLEGWRQWLADHIKSLNSYTQIYRIAKAYGLIVETGKPVVFHFETVGSLTHGQP